MPDDLKSARQTDVRLASQLGFLELFFPIHYTVGMKIEDTLRSGVLTRHQAIILWLIRSKGRDSKVMRRKDIETAMTDWFEVTSSAISKAVRSLSKPPLDLVEISEDPVSGREKLIKLTPRGEQFIVQMIDNGKELMKRAVDRLTDEEIATGLHFLARVSDVFDTILEEDARTARAGAKSEPSSAEPS